MPSARSVLLGTGSSTAELDDLERRFFRRLRLRNGTYKTTVANRMPSLDVACSRVLAGRDGARVLDLGVSSGITTADLLSQLEAKLRVAHVEAVDLVAFADLSEFGSCFVLKDLTGFVLQVGIGSWARGRPDNPRHSPKSFVADLSMRCAGALVPLLAGKSKRLALASHRLRQYPSAAFVEHDVFVHRADWDGRFDLVRVANLLNRAYFTEELLASAITSVVRYPSAEGYLLITRTDDEGDNHGTLWKRDATYGLKPVERFGSGSEVESLVESVCRSGS